MEEPPGGEGILDCSLGRNPLGVSEKVLKAAGRFEWSAICPYPDPFYKELRQRIVQFWADCAELKTEQVQIADGAIVLLERLNKLFIDPGSRVLGYSPQFTEYVTEVEASGGIYEAVLLRPEENFKFQVDQMLNRLKGEHSLVYLDNPNNPTGQFIPLDEIEAIALEAGKEEAVVIVDEAFGDYLGKESSAISLVNKYPNLVVVRTFSKAFGLAGLRVGYGVFSLELAPFYRKINVPFVISALSCYLAGEALADWEFIHHCKEIIRQEKRKLMEGLKQSGYLISETHECCPIFVLGCPDEALDLREELLAKGILTEGGRGFRNLGGNYVRVNTPRQADDFLSRL